MTTEHQSFDLSIFTTAEFDSPHSDDLLLLRDLKEEGLRADLKNWEAWKSTNNDSHGYIVRTTWGYYREIKKFREFLSELSSAGSCVWNPVELMRWNLNKRYLLELAKSGIPVVPTKLIAPGENLRFLEISQEFETESLVIKPAIGAGGHNTYRIELGDNLYSFEKEIAELRKKELLVQKFVSGVSQEGEYSLIYIDGSFTHCVLKTAASSEFRVQAEHGGTETKVPTPSGALQVADRVMRCLESHWEEILTARIDLVRTASNQWLVMEVELIEPQLFFRYAPEASRSLAQALSKRL